ncbi:MAG: ribonuclease HII [archaeon]
MLTLGIDDAGRGPLIGPMILGGVLWGGEIERKMKKENIKDSKMLSHPERIRLGKAIRTNALDYKIVKSYPEEIDACENLNTLEALKAAEIINLINVGKVRRESVKVIVDCPSVNTAVWKETMEGFVKYKGNLRIACEHKADANYLVVGAASILAKVIREEEVAKIRKQFGEIGSGYPSDPQTKKFLAEKGKELKDSGIFRKSWSTWKKMFPGSEQGQRTLGEF